MNAKSMPLQYIAAKSLNQREIVHATIAMLSLLTVGVLLGVSVATTFSV